MTWEKIFSCFSFYVFYVLHEDLIYLIYLYNSSKTSTLTLCKTQSCSYLWFVLVTPRKSCWWLHTHSISTLSAPSSGPLMYEATKTKNKHMIQWFAASSVKLLRSVCKQSADLLQDSAGMEEELQTQGGEILHQFSAQGFIWLLLWEETACSWQTLLDKQKTVKKTKNAWSGCTKLTPPLPPPGAEPH